MGTILIVDDSELQRRLTADLLKRRFPHACVEAESAATALAILRKDIRSDIFTVLLDLSMPGMDGREAIPVILKMRPGMPIIVITSTQNTADVVQVVKSGAFDYLVKPANPDLLHNAVRKAEQFAAMQQEIQRLRMMSGAAGFAALIGPSTAMRAAVKMGQRAAVSDITVMITGESGVGKEVMARAIHSESARAGKAFVAVNCGALPKDLVESTLFGHVKGAFTDAVADAAGKFREAEGGTLFLDEIGELPLAAQVKLLRALQQREVEPVGGGKTVPVNIRIIAATNRDLEQAVRQGFFREDLYYRLNVFPIPIAPLRDRADDIPVLAAHFLERYAAQENKKVTGFDAAAAAWLRAHPWPGNARELENRIYRAVLLCEGETIARTDLCPPSVIAEPAARGVAPLAIRDESGAGAFVVNLVDETGAFKTFDAITTEAENAALRYCEGNITLAAQKLGVGKSTLYRHRQG
ncbi:MAG: sigma-54-dependent Fis family transcriptional regulator [Alphaproteobacteria bacterium]|nr:sigma-54-dependent Fis family transcriptional regulator [Alphaproteobacteria bacterium]